MSSTPDPQSAPVTAPPKKSHYAMTAGDVSVRNIVWALGLTMGVVALVAILFFGVGGKADREIPENSRLDVAQSAARAQETVGFPVAVPATGDEWVARSARVDASKAEPTWEVRYTAPSGSLVSMVESGEVSAPLLSTAVPGAVVDADVTIAGAACQQLQSSTEESQRAVACGGDGWGLIVHGKAAQEELDALAELAISDISPG